MSGIAAIGEHGLVAGLAFAGVHVVAVEGPHEARAAWRALPEDVQLVILTPAARAALEEDGVASSDARLWAVMPG